MLLDTTYVKLRDERELKAFTGVDFEIYNILRTELGKVLAAKREELANRADRKRSYGGGGKSRLANVGDMLLFILHYYKAYPTMDVMASRFTMCRSSAFNHVHSLSKVLYQILVNLEVMPLREMPSIEEFKALLAAHTINQLIIDATERRIERPKDKEANTAQYSGKKNTIL